jgi:Aldo/keto reductases, related to diketogulonate reductase
MAQFMTLANGYTIPIIGFGTWKATEEQNEKIITKAIDAGYRYFDTASFYGTETYVGKAIAKSEQKREDFFIASKIWKDQLGYEETKKAFAGTLKALETEYLDMYLIHWPLPTPTMPENEWKQLNIDTWRAMEELYEEGKIRAIGVSNFLPHHLNNLLENCTIKPMINQLELHVGYMQHATVQYCREQGVIPQAWSPIGRGKVLTQPLIVELAKKYEVSPAKICLKYLLQQDIMIIPKASTPERMQENLLGFETFTITQEDMWRINTLPQMGWSGEHPDYERVFI